MMYPWLMPVVREAQEPQEVLKPLAASAAKECELPAGRI
jgi:hypothetical protein